MPARFAIRLASVRPFAIVLAALWPHLATAKITETVIDVPVSVKDIYGKPASQTIKVTVFREADQPAAPYLVLNHGRPPHAADLAKTPRYRYSEVSKYFVSMGFAVLVPTRVGYGESGGPDIEYGGTCDAKFYAPVYAAAAEQTQAVLAAAASLPGIDTSRGIVVGQSFGGTTAVAVASQGLPGLKGAVNFAGGGGGDPEKRPENPCSPQRLKAVFEDYGRAAKVPTLWLYSQNDRYWGEALPREWFSAYNQAGGHGQFVQLPPYRDNGHGIFSGDPQAWKPAFERFVRDLGF